MEDRSFERPPFAQRAPHQLQGPHSDIYSLGATIRLIFRLLEEHEPMLPQFSHIPGGQRYKDAARQNVCVIAMRPDRSLLLPSEDIFALKSPKLKESGRLLNMFPNSLFTMGEAKLTSEPM